MAEGLDIFDGVEFSSCTTNQTHLSICCSPLQLNSLDGPISLAAVHSFPSLFDSLKHLVVAQGVFGDDGRGLRFEADVVGFDAWKGTDEVSRIKQTE